MIKPDVGVSGKASGRYRVIILDIVVETPDQT
jgi:hypothetical protein